MDEAPRQPSDGPVLSGPTAANPQDAASMARGLSRKVMLAALFGGLVFAALALYGDVQQLRRAAMSFEPAAVALGFSLAAGNYVLRVCRWQYYLRCLGVVVPLFESSVVFLAGFVMSVTPGKVGEVFKSLLLYERRGVSMVRTAPIVIAERLTDLIALVLLTAVGSLAFENGVAIAAAGAVLVAGMVAVFAYRPLGEFCIGLFERIPAFSRIAHKVHEAYASLLTMLRPGPLLVGTLIALGAWGLECGTMYSIVRGFPKVALPWDAAVFAYSASTIVGALAMLPGGLGVTEAGMTGLLQALGGPAMTRAVATAATMLTRLATLWFAVAIGWVAFAIYRASMRREGRAAQVGAR
ncbi:MAG TPA: lysylphosphatidylglycerol synthase transmembrane domain-containing protein [Polyangiales bacterium]|nr:lysylphosphatidylglycerol synthase transmembrane domain-containing protein [Polyangiales bacterium]